MDPSERKNFLDFLEMPGPWHVACFITAGLIGGCLSVMGYGAYVWGAFGLLVLGVTCYCVWTLRRHHILGQITALRVAERQADVNAIYAGVPRSVEDRERAQDEIDRLTRKIQRLVDSIEREYAPPN